MTDSTIQDLSAAVRMLTEENQRLKAMVEHLTMIVDAPADVMGEDGEVKTVEDLNLRFRAKIALERCGVKYITQATRVTESDLRKHKNVGRHTVGDIRSELHKYGIRLKGEG